MSNNPSGVGGAFALFQRPFSARKTQEQGAMAPASNLGSAPGSAEQEPVVVSEETKRKVQAAKSYIENMYDLNLQKLQERKHR